MSAPRAVAPLGRRLVPVLRNEELGAYRLITVRDLDGPQPRAGQFFMLTAAAGWGDGATDQPGRPFLPRAFSACTARGADVGFLLEAVGPGTARLAALVPEEDLFLTGPLGRGFDPPESVGGEGAAPLLVGGGVGIPPLALWHAELLAAGVEAEVMLGFRSARYLPAASLFEGAAALATDDGSGGGEGGVHHGRVTELLARRLSAPGPVAVYGCGPPAMLEAVRALCAERDVPAQLALESGMACGFGACMGCVVATLDGYVRLCVEGPVIDAARLETALVPGVHA